MTVIFIIGLIALFFFGFQYFMAKNRPIDIVEEIKKMYIGKYTDKEQLIVSYKILAMRFNCEPEELKECYKRSLEYFSFDKLYDEKAALIKQKKAESNAFCIKQENTPASLLERWVSEIITFNEF